MAIVPPLNEKLIACVLDHIEQHRDEYDQNRWCWIRDLGEDQEYCGTRACFAGWAVLLSTPVEKWHKLPTGPNNMSGYDYYSVKAAELLGLTRSEAAYLFNVAENPHNPSVVRERLRKIRRDRGLPDEPARPRDNEKEVNNVEA